MKLLQFFKRKHKTKVETYWPLVQLQIEQDSYAEKQRIEDDKVQRAAEREAFDMFEQFKLDQSNCGLYIPKPQIYMITEYPGQKSRWDSTFYRKYVYTKFSMLKREFLRNKAAAMGC